LGHFEIHTYVRVSAVYIKKHRPPLGAVSHVILSRDGQGLALENLQGLAQINRTIVQRTT
jgi:hypothetical protein